MDDQTKEFYQKELDELEELSKMVKNRMSSLSMGNSATLVKELTLTLYKTKKTLKG